MVLQHPAIVETRTFDWPDEAACAVFAAKLAAAPTLFPSSFIALEGPLGAGKTTFVRHLLRALGVGGRIKSPTYAVLEPYTVDGQALSHFDFYRFDDAREWDDAGFRDVFAAPGVKLVEWPDKAAAVLPVPDWSVRIEPDDNETRRVRVAALSDHGVALLHALG